LASRYGLNQISVLGLDPEQDISPRVLANIQEIILQKKLKAIFTEPLANPDIVNAIASATRVTTLTLDPIETFATEDYFALQYKNLSNLKIALECR
jgi:zinc transport system substrate-binding protein